MMEMQRSQVNQSRRFWHPRRCIVLLLALMLGNAAPASADSFNQTDRGLPGRRVPGGTRSPVCVTNPRSYLTALVPMNNVGLTTADYPRFFWFMPQNRAVSAEFSLYDTDEHQIENDLLYKTEFKVSGESGIASLKLPESLNLPALEVGNLYFWTVSLVCDADDRTRDISVSGWVKRIEPGTDFTRQLSSVRGIQKANLLAQNGFWFDTLETLAELRCVDPQNPNIAANWVSVLNDDDVVLGQIANQPILDHCQVLGQLNPASDVDHLSQQITN